MLPTIIDVAGKGSVISRDHAVSILTKLASRKDYADRAVSLLVAQLRSCPSNQLPMYAEKAVAVIREKDRELFLRTLKSRLAGIEKQSKRRRVESDIKAIPGLTSRPSPPRAAPRTWLRRRACQPGDFVR